VITASTVSGGVAGSGIGPPAVRVGAATARERVPERIGDALGAGVYDDTGIEAAPAVISEAMS
jgi:hypothetical protein